MIKEPIDLDIDLYHLELLDLELLKFSTFINFMKEDGVLFVCLTNDTQLEEIKSFIEEWYLAS